MRLRAGLLQWMSLSIRQYFLDELARYSKNSGVPSTAGFIPIFVVFCMGVEKSRFAYDCRHVIIEGNIEAVLMITTDAFPKAGSRWANACSIDHAATVETLRSVNNVT